MRNRSCRRLLTGFALLAASPAAARDYCPDRPGIDTPPCTMDKGKLSAEVSLGDWTRDSNPDSVSDAWLIGDLALRLGIADHAEVRLAWSPYGHVRSRDRATGAIDNEGGTGDVTIGLKRNLVAPDGKGFSVALLPSVSLPTGGAAIGAGDWGAGLQLPIAVPLNDVVTLDLTPEIDAAVDGDRDGRHVAYGTAGGISLAPLPRLNLAIEAEVMRDEDPAGASSQEIVGIAAGYMLSERCQIDAGTEIALNGATPDSRVYIGIARRF